MLAYNEKVEIFMLQKKIKTILLKSYNFYH